MWRIVLLPGGVAQEGKGGPVDAENAGAVQRVGEHAAVHGGEQPLQGLALLEDLRLVSPLLGDVDAHAHRAHYGAVQVIEGRFVSSEGPHPLAGLDDLLGDAGLFGLHDDPL